MNFPPIFKLHATRTKLVIPNMSRAEFVRRLTKVTESSSFLGFLPPGKVFHGYVNNEGFRLKHPHAFGIQQFTVFGDMSEEHNKLVVRLRFNTTPSASLVIVSMMVLIAALVINLIITDQFDWNYFPFVAGALILFVFLTPTARGKQIDRMKEVFLGAID